MRNKSKNKKYLFIIIIYFLISVLNYANSKSYIELEKIINNEKNITRKNLILLREEEFIDLIFSGEVKHILHSLFITYDIGHRFSKKNNSYEIKNINTLRMLSRKFDIDLYISSSLSLTNYIEDLNQRKKILLELKNSKQNINKKYIVKIYSALALNYYAERNLNYAMLYWKKMLTKYNKNQKFEKSSILNNISLAYNKRGDLVNAIYYNDLAQLELNNIKNKSLEQLDFLNILIANKADYYFYKNKYSKALELYKIALNFYLSNKKYNIYAAEVVLELLKLNNKISIKNTFNISQIEEIYFRNKKNKILNDLELENKHLLLFISFFKSEHNYFKSSLYYDLYLKNITLENKEKTEKLKLVNEQIEKDNERKFFEKNEANKLYQTTKTKHQYITILFILILLASFTIYKIKTIQRKTKIITQQNELEQVRQKAIENELKFQKESNLHLQLNLDIKQKSEQLFMEKLKEIRRKKHNDPEEIIKELQLQIINLLQIDKKNKNKRKEKSSDDNSFTINLIALNKNLSEQELRLCTYFKMNLSTKEISQLEQHLAPASIRVLKNRIKKKLELGPEDNLNQFLNSLGIEI